MGEWTGEPATAFEEHVFWQRPHRLREQTCACTYFEMRTGFVYHVTRAFQRHSSEAAIMEKSTVTFISRYM